MSLLYSFFKNIILNLLFSFFIIAIPVLFFLNSTGYYKSNFNRSSIYSQYKESAVTVNIEFENMIDYINFRKSDLNKEFYSTEDIIHLQDVRSIVGVFYILFTISFISVIITWKRNQQNFFDTLSNAAKINLLLVPILFLIINFDFYNIFITFHKILFRNEYWMLDPATSNLIKYFPERVFQEIALLIGLFVIMISILTILICRKKTRS